jgi:hypothetical protein
MRKRVLGCERVYNNNNKKNPTTKIAHTALLKARNGEDYVMKIIHQS